MRQALKSKGFIVNILLLLGSFIFSICMVEGGLRYFTVFPIHGQGNLQYHRLLGYTLSSRLSDVDSEGFRNPSGVSKRIVAIGDSHTYSYHVTYKDSWPAKLSSKIQKPVYNFGVGGYSVLHYGVLLANLPSDVREIILGLYVANDFDYFKKGDECITPVGKESIKQEFGVTVPTCEYEYKKFQKGIRTRLKENTAIVSAIYYLIERYQGKEILKKQDEYQDDIINIDGEPIIKIDGVPVGLKREIYRHNSITDRTNPEVADRVDYFVALVKRFKELHPDITLKILMIPSKEVVLHSAELKCPRSTPSGVVLNESNLKNYLMRTLSAAGIQIEDALAFTLEKYCHSSNEGRDGFYPVLDGHPFAEGYEAYAQAAYVLYNRP